MIRDHKFRQKPTLHTKVSMESKDQKFVNYPHRKWTFISSYPHAEIYKNQNQLSLHRECKKGRKTGNSKKGELAK